MRTNRMTVFAAMLMASSLLFSARWRLILISLAICHAPIVYDTIPTAMGELIDSFVSGWNEARKPCRECRKGFLERNCRTCPHMRPKSVAEALGMLGCLIVMIFVFAIVAAMIA